MNITAIAQIGMAKLSKINSHCSLITHTDTTGRGRPSCISMNNDPKAPMPCEASQFKVDNPVINETCKNRTARTTDSNSALLGKDIVSLIIDM